MAFTLTSDVDVRILEENVQQSRRTNEATDATVAEWVDDTYTVAASETDHSLPFVGVSTATYVYLEFDGACTFQLGGTAGADIPIAAGGVILLTGVTLTSIVVTTTGSPVTIRRIFAD